jgi:hypothetical protein
VSTTTPPSTKPVVNVLHIGKTGGSAVKFALAHDDRIIGDVVTERCLIRLHGHETALRHVPRGERVVFFLRDPVTRFVSGFHSRLRRGEPRHHFPWSADEAVAFERFHTPNELASALTSEDHGTREAAVAAMHAIVHVRSSYWDWFTNERYFLRRLPDILFVGFQESLVADFEALKAKLALPDATRLPTDEIAAHATPDDVDRELDATAVRNLRDWYARDYEFVALCRAKASEIDRSTL